MFKPREKQRTVNDTQQSGTPNLPCPDGTVMNEQENLPEEQAASVVQQTSVEGFFHGVRNYMVTVRRVWLRRSQLIATAAPDEAPRSLSASIACFITGLLVSYIFYLPTAWSVEPKMTKWLFLTVFLFSQILTLLIIHLALKIVGGNASLRDTASVYLTWSGIIYPILFALQYPFWIYFSLRATGVSGGSHLFDPIKTSWRPWTFASAIVFIASSYIPLRWLSFVHRISVKRELIGVTVFYFPLMFLNGFLLPYERELVKALGEIFDRIMS